MAEETPTEAQRVAARVTASDLVPTPQFIDQPRPAAPAIPVWFERFPTVPGYRITAELGRGGMGVVYEARQQSLNRRVALKMIRTTAVISATEVARFLAEAEVLASVRHPNVVQVFECGMTPATGSSDAAPYMALELVTGGTLAHLLLDRGALEPHTAAEILAAVADGVQAVHDAGIVHRDLKPANILLGEGVPKVSDFGVARRDGSDLTATGIAVGTPEYMAPEQAAGRSKFVGPTADVWALGVILFEALTGERPFRGEDVWSVVHAVLNGPTPAVRGSVPAVPRDLALICHKCLEKDQHDRYASAADLASDLRRFLAGKPVTVRPLGPLSRVWRASRRNPVVAGLIAAVALSSALGAGVSVHQAIDANRSAEWANAEAKRARVQEEIATREAANARNAMAAMAREEMARKAADALSVRTLRVALYSRELGEAWHALATGDVQVASRAAAACDPEIRRWEWQLLDRWLARRAHVLPPIPGPFTSHRLAVSSDGRWVAACGLSKPPVGPAYVGSDSIWLWDLKAGGPPVQLEGDFVWSLQVLAFDAAAGCLIAASDYAVRVWNLADLTRPVREVRLGPPAHDPHAPPPPRVAAVQLIGDRATAVVAPQIGNTPAKLVTWALKGDGKPTEAELPGSEGTAAAAFAPDGKSLLLAGGEGRGFVRRVGLDGKVLGGPVALNGTPVWVAFAPAGVGAVVGMVTSSDDSAMVAWDGVSQNLARQTSFRGRPETAEVRRDGRILFTAPDGLWVWDPSTGTAETPARFGRIGGAAAFPDSRRLVVGDHEGGVRVWEPVGPHEAEFAREQHFGPTALSGDRVVVVSGGRLLLRASGKGSPDEHTPDPAVAGYNAVAWAGNRVALVLNTQAAGNAVMVYDPRTRSVAHRWALRSDGPVRGFAADRSRLAVHFEPVPGKPDQPKVEVRAADTGALLAELRVPRDGAHVGFLAFSPDGRYLAATRMPDLIAMLGTEPAMPPGRLTVWDLAAGELRWDVEVAGGTRAPAFSADGTLVATCGSGRDIAARQVTDGRLVRMFTVPTKLTPRLTDYKSDGLKSLTFSPDGSRVLAAGSAGLTLWDAATGQVVCTIPAPCDEACFSPDGRRLHAIGAGRVVTYEIGAATQPPGNRPSPNAGASSRRE